MDKLLEKTSACNGTSPAKGAPVKAARSCCFGVRHGARKIARATLACSFSSESASSAEMAPCHSGGSVRIGVVRFEKKFGRQPVH